MVCRSLNFYNSRHELVLFSVVDMTPHDVLWFSSKEVVLSPLQAVLAAAQSSGTRHVNRAGGLQDFLLVARFPYPNKARKVACQKCARSEATHWRSCGDLPSWEVLPVGTAPLHLPTAAEHQYVGALGSFLRLNSKGASSFHRASFPQAPLTLMVSAHVPS